MIERTRESWQAFRESEPGCRFRDRYHRRQQRNRGRFDVRKALYVVVGVVIVLVGLVAVPAPGPGWAIVFVGVGMIAGEFLPIARFLDWAEVRLGGAARWARELWRRSPIAVKVLAVLIALTGVAAAAYGAYYIYTGL